MSLPSGRSVATHRFLAGLPEPTADLVAGCAREAHFDAGSLLFGEGGEADTFYLIERGRVALEVHGPGAGRLVIETVGPGGVVGFSWVAPPFRWQLDARAVEATSAIALDTAQLRSRLAENPAVAYALVERLSGVLLAALQAARLRLLDLYGDGGRR